MNIEGRLGKTVRSEDIDTHTEINALLGKINSEKTGENRWTAQDFENLIQQKMARGNAMFLPDGYAETQKKLFDAQPEDRESMLALAEKVANRRQPPHEEKTAA